MFWISSYHYTTKVGYRQDVRQLAALPPERARTSADARKVLGEHFSKGCTVVWKLPPYAWHGVIAIRYEQQARKPMIMTVDNR